ncbi:unnamed protein product [Effrenium voratum]|nr:unnamed protein product [Effrenium voratum]
MAELLAAPLEKSEIEELKALFPDFQGEVPEEAAYWKKSDLELFIASNGQLRPKGEAPKAASAFLSRARQALAERKIGEASQEYLSWCRHLRAGSSYQPAVASCKPVASAPSCPAVPRNPLVVPCPKTWCGQPWTLDFWRLHGSQMWWTCRSKSPAFERDRKGQDTADVEGSPSEYVDYARLLQQMDPQCSEENALAYPRLMMDGWCPFISTEGLRLLERHWKELAPPGVRDLSAKWIRMFTKIFNLEFLDFFARFFKVSLGAPGCISRLHVTNNGGHTWYTQLEGRRLFVLFSPAEAAKLAQEEGGAVDHVEGYAAAVSPVDIFFPNPKRHAALATANAQTTVLEPGQSLIVPAGWWHYAVHLEASATLHHAFWGLQTRGSFSEELREAFIASKMPADLREMADRNISELHGRIMDDDDDDSDLDV